MDLKCRIKEKHDKSNYIVAYTYSNCIFLSLQKRIAQVEAAAEDWCKIRQLCTVSHVSILYKNVNKHNHDIKESISVVYTFFAGGGG